MCNEEYILPRDFTLNFCFIIVMIRVNYIITDNGTIR